MLGPWQLIANGGSSTEWIRAISRKTERCLIVSSRNRRPLCHKVSSCHKYDHSPPCPRGITGSAWPVLNQVSRARRGLPPAALGTDLPSLPHLINTALVITTFPVAFCSKAKKYTPLARLSMFTGTDTEPGTWFANTRCSTSCPSTLKTRI